MNIKTPKDELRIQKSNAKRNPKYKKLSGIGIKTINPKMLVKPKKSKKLFLFVLILIKTNSNPK